MRVAIGLIPAGQRRINIKHIWIISGLRIKQTVSKSIKDLPQSVKKKGKLKSQKTLKYQAFERKYKT